MESAYETPVLPLFQFQYGSLKVFELYYPKADLFQNLIFKIVHGYLSKKMLFLAGTSDNRKENTGIPWLPVFSKKGLIKDIMKLNGLNLRKTLRKMKWGCFVSKELVSELNYSYDIHRDTIRCKNIVGLLPGSVSGPKKEYMVIGPHLDCQGVGKSVKGDSIYNGLLWTYHSLTNDIKLNP